jgi:hypothetical protein
MKRGKVAQPLILIVMQTEALRPEFQGSGWLGQAVLLRPEAWLKYKADETIM